MKKEPLQIGDKVLFVKTIWEGRIGKIIAIDSSTGFVRVWIKNTINMGVFYHPNNVRKIN